MNKQCSIAPLGNENITYLIIVQGRLTNFSKFHIIFRGFSRDLLYGCHLKWCTDYFIVCFVVQINIAAAEGFCVVIIVILRQKIQINSQERHFT